MIIYLVRHGEVDNPQDLTYARLPGFHLSEQGRESVAKMAQAVFANKLVAAIYHSPLERTVETAQVIQANMKSKPPLLADERLLEINLVSLAGKPMAVMEQTRVEEGIPGWYEKYVDEGYADVQGRLMSLIQESQQLYPQQEVIFVSHGDPIHLTLLALQGLSIEQFRRVNVRRSSVHEVRLNGKPKCRLLYEPS